MAAVAELQVEVDPAEAGFDPERLERIDRYFARAVGAGEIPCALAVVSRGGRVAHIARENTELDTLWRVYSQTKTVTSVATMMLYEEGAFDLRDPIAKFIPAFEDMEIFVSGSAQMPTTIRARQPITIWHLLTHTSGMTAGFFDTAVDVLYRQTGLNLPLPWYAFDDAEYCERIARLPLLFEPGTEWNYGNSVEVLGRLVEVVSGKRLDQFFAERILGPLGMTESDFVPREEDRHRFAELHAIDPASGRAVPMPTDDVRYDPRPERPKYLAGGIGLISTAADFQRFALMLLGRGELDGVRLLGSRTVDYMTLNHLPGGVLLDRIGRPLFDMDFGGLGFGLGFSVVEDPAARRVLTPKGVYGWSGAAGTTFWVDPANEIVVLFFTQIFGYRRAAETLRQLVYQALVD